MGLVIECDVERHEKSKAYGKMDSGQRGMPNFKNAKVNHNILLIDLHNSLEMKTRKRLTRRGVPMILDCEVVRSQVIYAKLGPFSIKKLFNKNVH